MAYRQADALVWLFHRFWALSIKDDFLGVINDPGAAV
jgi:hypothetical protein